MRIQHPNTTLESAAFSKRLDALGLRPDENGNIDPGALAKLRGSVPAEALTKGVLTHADTVELRRPMTFLESFTGRDASISAKSSNAVKSLAMSVDGLGGAMRSFAKELKYKLSVDAGEIEAVTRRVHHVHKGLVDQQLQHLGTADPAAVGALVQSLDKLASTSSEYLVTLSALRSAVLKVEGGFLTRVAQSNVLDGLFEATKQVEALQTLSQELIGATVTGSRAAAKANDIGGGRLSKAELEELSGVMERIAKERGIPLNDLAEKAEQVIDKAAVSARALELIALVQQGSGSRSGEAASGYGMLVVVALEAHAAKFPDAKSFRAHEIACPA